MSRRRNATWRVIAAIAGIAAAIGLAWCDAQLQGGEASRPPSDPFVQP